MSKENPNALKVFKIAFGLIVSSFLRNIASEPKLSVVDALCYLSEPRMNHLGLDIASRCLKMNRVAWKHIQTGLLYSKPLLLTKILWPKQISAFRMCQYTSWRCVLNKFWLLKTYNTRAWSCVTVNVMSGAKSSISGVPGYPSQPKIDQSTVSTVPKTQHTK